MRLHASVQPRRRRDGWAGRSRAAVAEICFPPPSPAGWQARIAGGAR